LYVLYEGIVCLNLSKITLKIRHNPKVISGKREQAFQKTGMIFDACEVLKSVISEQKQLKRIS